MLIDSMDAGGRPDPPDGRVLTTRSDGYPRTRGPLTSVDVDGGAGSEELACDKMLDMIDTWHARSRCTVTRDVAR
ncbi:hypothetical protein GCM10009648_34470 [Tsukamurella spumae]